MKRFPHLTLAAGLGVLLFFTFAASPVLTAQTLTPKAVSAADEKKEVKWYGYEDGVAAAKAEKKNILIDVYTDWCGWCKKMDKDVYTNAGVRDLLDKHYIAIKLNAESKTTHTIDGKEVTEIQIAKALGANSYPTTAFMNSETELITVTPGYIQANTFVVILDYISGEHYKDTKWNDFVAKQPK